MHSLFGIVASSFRSASAFFTSLYESFADLTSIINQHFVEWFSGSDISTIWTKRNIAGAGSFAMQDAVDGGFGITTGATTNDRSAIDFNLKRQYDHQNSEFIVVAKTTKTTTYWLIAGMKASNTSYSPDGYYVWNTSQSFTKFGCGSYGGASGSNTEGSIAQDTNWHTFKLVISASNLKFYVDGVLDVTKTTNLPTAKLEPFCWAQTDAASTHTNYFRYVECYNNTVSILSTLYERLSALTQVMNQRVVEWFGGNDVDTTKWTKRNGSGSGTFAVADETDGGYSITTGSTVNNESGLDFNSKRQYDHQNSEIIVVSKRVSATCAVECGFSNGNAALGGLDSVTAKDYTANTFKQLYSADASASSTTNSDVAIDTSWHVYKIANTSANLKLYIDGVLKVTKTTNRPTQKLQPFVNVFNASTGAGREGRFRYLEAWNTLATPTNYPSVYEMFQALTDIMKTRFVEWFSGSVLNPKWTTNNYNGTGTFTVNDSIDGGQLVQCGGTSGNQSGINFNSKRQYDPANSVIIIVQKRDTASTVADFGLSNVSVGSGGSYLDVAMMRDYTGDTFKTLVTADATTISSTASDVAIDTAWTLYKLECGASNIKMYINGVLKVTKTTNRPTVKMNPFIRTESVSSGTRSQSVRFLEAYNT